MSAVAERPLNWRSQYNFQKLGKNDIDLWLVDISCLHGAEMDDQYFERLPAAEIDRSKKIKDDEKRRLYLGGRGGLRVLLENYTGIENDKLEFGYGARGKPRLLNPLDDGILEFNYTLSSGYALYGFSWDRKLGVDLEIYPRPIEFNRFAQRILTSTEMDAWMEIPEERKNNIMLSCWTRKEAYGKLLGFGIRYAMNQAELFTNLSDDNWRTTIEGMFDNTVPVGINIAYGIQLELPVPGAASLMYSQASENLNRQDKSCHREPKLNAFCDTLYKM